MLEEDVLETINLIFTKESFFDIKNSVNKKENSIIG
jgi:hypothetical protein